MGDLTLITGGARSGKSAFAERLALDTTHPVTYIATLEPLDDEMRDRVARHRARRPPTWRTVEAVGDAGGELAEAARTADDGDTVLLDCLAVWTSNRLLALREDEPTPDALAALEDALAEELRGLLDTLATRSGPAILVTNEVGGGLVPPYALGRAYRDLLGRVNQQVSRAARQAYLVVAGRALALPPPFEHGQT
ncbi:MAG: bifunctional adenosylcobinamide kinase/adenosylcobinamide-phosphate guanylyltransferase [Dehalococcoidia bacterium]